MDILIVDDDYFSQKIISRAFQDEFSIHLASNGQEGLARAKEIQPAIIILDVEMPGMNGYEVCAQLKQDEKTKAIPIVFLSGCGTLRDRLQGYEVGGDDYLVKPFEAETLTAKVKVLVKYVDQQNELHEQYELAQKTANIAMTGSSELGLAMRFVEDSFYLNEYEDLANVFFSMTDSLALRTTLMFITDDDPVWFCSSGAVSPLESQLLDMIHNENRFYDFGCRTIITFPNVSLLIKNMPIHDMERYGRIKDLLPVILGALNGKIYTLNTEKALKKQSANLTVSNDKIKTSLLELSNSLQRNQEESTTIMRKMLDELSMHLPYLGLEEDQEEYILECIEKSIDKSVDLLDSNKTTSNVFEQVIFEMKGITEMQNNLIQTLFKNKATQDDSSGNDSEYSMDVELF